ncbi:MAG: endonuclease/exonuclease/phosphatase family protein [Calditrichaeota bacterium]|nr:endonuclease/exonuclease/phosphatase family protein [Calditrichota bacterium]
MEFHFPSAAQPLTHQLNPIFDEIKTFKSRRAFQKSGLFRQYSREIHRVENGLEWENHYDGEAAPGEAIRVAAWNIERGINLSGIIDTLAHNPVLARADVLLLTEVDIGMGRSGNFNIPREIARRLKLNYCFANSFLVLAKGDEGEQSHELENTLSLHGTAILSRHKMHACIAPVLPAFKDYFGGLEKRLGRRRALICRIAIGGGLYDFAAGHLDLHSSPLQRAWQLQCILRTLRASPAQGQIFGGDLNTHTYHLENKWRLFLSFLYKTVFLGIRAGIAHYMTPEVFFEKCVFDMFRRYGFDFKQLNDSSRATLYYDIHEPTLRLKTRNHLLSGWMFDTAARLLCPWNGRVPMRLDWLAARRFRVLTQPCGEYGPPQVIDLPADRQPRISDHLPIVADVMPL